MENFIEVSVVVPVYSGKDYLKALLSKIDEVKRNWIADAAPLRLSEAIFVDDASKDGSGEVLNKFQEDYSWVKVINLSRNFGQHQATIAGILHTSGDWVVTMDEDLQHDPKFVDVMLKAAVSKEMDVVYAKPERQVHESFFRDMSSRCFKKMVSALTGNSHVKQFNSFRLMRGEIARGSSSVCAHGTYFDIALGWFTERVTALELPLKDMRYVETGKSGYSLRKLLSHARRMIVSSEAKVLRIGSIIGAAAMAVATIFGSKVFVQKILYPDSISIQGWTSLILTVLFFSGLIAVLTGIMLEYLSVILLHIQGKPTFFVVDRSHDKTLSAYYSSS